MCKHVINSTIYMQASCCGIWVECTECHDEKKPDHQFKFQRKMKFTCKCCRKRFDRDFMLFSEKDKKCNFCGVEWNKPGETPESKMFAESNAVLHDILASSLDTQNYFFNTLS